MLQIKDLKVSFRTANGVVDAVKGSGFTLAKGETVGIVGESGSGKSVTSLAVMRLHDPKNTIISGELWLDDINILSLSEDEMRDVRGNRIAMIFQEPMTSLNPVLTCGHQVTEAIQLHLNLSKSDAKKRTIEL